MNHPVSKFTKVALGPVLAALSGLSSVLILGAIHWPLAMGLPGIAIGALVAVAVAMLLRMKLNWTTSVVASICGAAVACFFAIASAEVLPAGSLLWVMKGGLYGAAWGLPVALLMSPLALLIPLATKSSALQE